MFDKILVAVDGSERSRRAAGVGIDLARACGAAVEVVYVVEKRSVLGDYPRASAREAGRGVLDDVAEDAAGRGLSVETALLEGRPHRAVLHHAREGGADLVVVGRRGRRGLGQHLLGSVTERLLRTSEVPVLAVPAAGDRPAAFERILVTTDGSDAAERAAPVAAGLAKRVGASLDVLSVVDVDAAAGVFDAGGVDREYVERLERRGRAAVDRVADRVGGDLAVETAVVEGTVHEGIREYVETRDVDLVVMSSTGQSNLAGQHLGSTTGRVLRTSRVPVLVVTGE